jgi:hypothetical protein
LEFFFKTSARSGNFKLIVDSVASAVMAVVKPNAAAVTLRYQMPFQSWLKDGIEDLQLDVFGHGQFCRPSFFHERICSSVWRLVLP